MTTPSDKSNHYYEPCELTYEQDRIVFFGRKGMSSRARAPREIWRIVPDFENYAVSSQGRVANTSRYTLLNGRRGTDGRRKVRLYRNGEWIDKYVHQLMAMAFVIGHEWGDPVGHKNRIYWDNRLENLLLYRYNFGFCLEPEWDYWED